MKLQIKNILNFFVLLWFLFGCKTPSKITEKSLQKMPDAYANSSDTVCAGTLKWQLFYQDPHLKNLIDTALNNNLDLLSAIQKIEISKNQFQLKKSELLPVIGANAGIAQRRFGNYTMDGAGNASTFILPNQIVPENLRDFQLGLNTNWEVDVWGKLRNKKKAALARYSGSIAAKNAIQSILIAEIASTYYELIALDNELDIIKETYALQQAALDIIKIKKEAGMLNELAVKQFEGEVLHSKSFELQISQLIKITENHLNYLCGRFPQPILRDKSSFTQFKYNISAGIPSQLLTNRPDIQEAELELIASKCDVKAAKAAFYPSFNITGTIGFQAFKSSLLFQTPESFAYSIIGGLSAPILNRKAIQTQFNTAKAYQTESLIKYQKMILNGYIEVANEISNIEMLQKTFDLKNKEVFTYEKSIEIANDLFKSGRATYLEVLTVQRTALEAKIDLLNTKKTQHKASINLYKALGGGWQ